MLMARSKWTFLRSFLRSFILNETNYCEELEKLAQNLSNPKELINYTAQTASKLPTVWASGDYYKKQIFQNTIFPQGLAYDAKLEHYRTPIVNSVFGHVADLSKALSGNKKRDLSILLEKSPVVPSAGLEPARFPTGV